MESAQAELVKVDANQACTCLSSRETFNFFINSFLRTNQIDFRLVGLIWYSSSKKFPEGGGVGCNILVPSWKF